MTASRIVIAAFVGLWSVSAWAQTPPVPADNPSSADQQNQPANNDPNAMKTGDQATGDQAATGPEIVDDPNATPEQKASAAYSGPAVLSRAISASEPMNPKNTKFTPTVGVEYIYNSGLTGVSLLPNGQLANSSNASGMQLTYGLTGTKLFKKDIFSLSFSGGYYYYPQASQYDGSSDSLAMTWKHALSRHLSVGLRVAATEYDQNNLLLSGSEAVVASAGSTLLTSTPTTEAFDGRVISLYTQGDVTYQMTSRLSINLSGGGFLTRRESTALDGDTGYQSSADLAYRITRHVTLGGYYSYTHFDFIGSYGSTGINTVGTTYSIAFTPLTELIMRVGASRLVNVGIVDINVSPLLALLFGAPVTEEAVNLVTYTPDVNVQLRHQVARSTLTLLYARGVTPGNGIILTSTRQTGSFGVNYKVGRNWNFNSSGGYDSLVGFGISNQKYTSVYFDGNVYRAIAFKGLNWHARVDFHHYLFNNTNFLRNTFVVATGIVWNPGDLLERVW